MYVMDVVGICPVTVFLLFSENEKITSLLEAIKQKNVTLDSLRYASDTPCSSPSGKPYHIYLSASTPSFSDPWTKDYVFI